MLGNEHFYNRTIRKVVVSFGTIFNDIELIRFDKEGVPHQHMRVPLSYGSKEKYITRLSTDPTLTKSIATLVPRISFNLDGLSYDSNRKQISTLQNLSYSSDVRLKTQYVPVPYNFDFSMSIYVRNTEDGTQILEQILPFFTPDFTVTVNFIDDMEKTYDLPIILNNVTSNVDYEGDMMSTRLITWDLNFTAKGYIWPMVKKNVSGLIGTYSENTGENGASFSNLYVDPTMNTIVANISVQPDPLDAEPDDEYGFSETITEFPIN